MRAIRRLLGLVLLGFVAIAAIFVSGMRSKSPRVLNAVRRTSRATKQYVLPTAGIAGSPNGIVKHVGRKSGREYETPIQPVATADGFAIALPYGSNSDWLQNVLAAGRATIVLDGAESEVDHPEIVSMAEANPLFPPSQQRMHRLFRVEQCLRLRRVGGAPSFPGP
jgi:deazaflavin-dependent oxidoreductase (nitroreductase family)